MPSKSTTYSLLLRPLHGLICPALLQLQLAFCMTLASVLPPCFLHGVWWGPFVVSFGCLHIWPGVLALGVRGRLHLRIYEVLLCLLHSCSGVVAGGFYARCLVDSFWFVGVLTSLVSCLLSFLFAFCFESGGGAGSLLLVYWILFCLERLDSCLCFCVFAPSLL